MKYYYYFPDTKYICLKQDCNEEDIKDKKNAVLVILGQNQKENDQIVKEADGDDMWFHVAEHPSGHAIYTGDNISKDAIIQVAQLVKEQSKLKTLKKVTVDYIEIKHLKSTKELGKVILKKTPNKIVV